jgi:hypothetical protein
VNKKVYGQRILFTSGILFKVIADVWAILVQEVFFPRLQMSGNLCLRQYTLGFFFLVFAGILLTVWCFRTNSVRWPLLVLGIALANAIFLFILYAQTLQGRDVFGTDAYVLVSAYLCVLWAIVALIVGSLQKRPRPKGYEQP